MRQRVLLPAALAVAILFSLVPVASAQVVYIDDFHNGFYSIGDDLVPNGWTESKVYIGHPENAVSTISQEPGSEPGSLAVQWTRPNGGQFGGTTGIVYDLHGLSVSGLTNLMFTMNVNVLYNSLPGGGDPWWGAMEWPAYVAVFYRDKDDVLKVWQHGWATDNPLGYSKGTVVESDEWTPVSFDLLKEIPDLSKVEQLGLGGGGWSFAGRVNQVTLSSDSQPVPEPCTSTLLLTGGAMWLLGLRRKKK